MTLRNRKRLDKSSPVTLKLTQRVVRFLFHVWVSRINEVDESTVTCNPKVRKICGFRGTFHAGIEVMRMKLKDWLQLNL